MTPRECAFAGAAFLSTDAQQLLALEGVPESLREALRRDASDLEREYVRLFLSPAGALCPLWQSAHEAERSLMGEAHRSASRWYASYGAVPAAGNDPADHVGLLLTFYAQMLVSGVSDEELRGFAQRHLSWIPAFAASVAASAELGFYREFGKWVALSV